MRVWFCGPDGLELRTGPQDDPALIGPVSISLACKRARFWGYTTMKQQPFPQELPCKQSFDSPKIMFPFRIGAELIRLLISCGLLWCCSSGAFAADGAKLSSVLVNEIGEWRPFAVGELVASPNTGNGGSTYWRTVPEAVRSMGLEHYFLTADSSKTSTVEYGKLDFTVMSDGPVWVLTTASFFDSGNSDGNWQTEVRTQLELEADGSRVVARDVQSEYGYEPSGKNQSLLEWILFERTCKAGQQFSIRTEKYQSPVILRTRPPKLRAFKYKSGGLIIEAYGSVGRYKLQSSSDLKTWVDDSDAVLNSLEFALVMGSSFHAPSRFYRLVSP